MNPKQTDRLKRGGFLPLFYFIAVWISDPLWAQRTISISEIPLGDAVMKSGRRLIDIPNGFIEVRTGKESKADTIFVAVHGYESRGYEWVYAVRKMAETGNKTLFYRYDWTLCPADAAEHLLDSLAVLSQQNPELGHLIIFSHSLGGTVTTELAGILKLPVLVEIHSIAAPLGYHPRLGIRCGYEAGVIFNSTYILAEGVDHVQWRTVHEMDGAFKKLDFDPQVVKITGSRIIQLPPTFRDGKRLGHNWSITWAMDEFLK